MGRSTSLADEQQRTLERLRPLVAADALYLAGGTAVAHHIGHRRSLDLDLFSGVRAFPSKGSALVWSPR